MPPLTVPLSDVTVLGMTRSIHARAFKGSFDDVKRDWFGGNTAATQLFNSINLLFPEGERFFIRAVKRYEDWIADPELRARMRGFYAQEGHHANAHERYFNTLREQGYDIEPIVTGITKLLRAKVLSPETNLSITVALEHYTAIMAELMYTDPFFAKIEEPIRSLLLWHAAEEIEHKAVAFDVMKQVDPSYSLRMRGYAIATVMLAIIWGAGTTKLLREDPAPLSKIMSDIGKVLRNGVLGRKIFWRAFREYVRPDFHPDDNDNYALIRDYVIELDRKAA